MSLHRSTWCAVLTMCVAAVGFSLVQLGEPNAEAQTVARLGSLFPATNFDSLANVRLAETIAQKTAGKIKVELFPASQLGSENEQTEQVRSGALQFHISGGSFQQYVPEAQIIGLPGLWKNHDHVFRVMTSDVGKQIIEMAEKKNIGIKILAFVTTGERYFYGRKRAFENTADFAGIKIRVDTMPASAAIWRTLRANPVPMPLTEVYSALQTGVIDAAEYPPCVALSAKTYEQAKYITTTAHQLTLLALQVNQKWHEGLPADLRGQLRAAVEEWLPVRYQMAKEAEGGCIAKMKEQGAEVHALKDPDKLRATLEPIQKEFGDKYNLNDLIAKIKAMN